MTEFSANPYKGQLWAFRIALIIFFGLLGFMDRILTEKVVAIAGIAMESNPIARVFNVNPWFSLVGYISAMLLFAWCYIKTDSERTEFFIDVVLIVLTFANILIVLNNTLALAGLK